LRGSWFVGTAVVEQAIRAGHDVTGVQPGPDPGTHPGRRPVDKRMRRSGRVLAPGRPDRGIQPVDVRDLAKFLLDLITQGGSGLQRGPASGPGNLRRTAGRLRAHRRHHTRTSPGSMSSGWPNTASDNGPNCCCGASRRIARRGACSGLHLLPAHLPDLPMVGRCRRSRCADGRKFLHGSDPPPMSVTVQSFAFSCRQRVPMRLIDVGVRVEARVAHERSGGKGHSAVLS
jgi:hypothetical protein